MKIAVIGAGPAGLFFARRMKLARPDWTLQVFEQSARDTTYGFGVGLLGQSLSFIERTDPEMLAAIRAAAYKSSSMGFVHNGETVVVDAGSDGESVAIERIRLLNILQDLAEAVGVELFFKTRIEDIDAERKEVDLLVGADGVNSRVRCSFADEFGATVEPQRNIFAWYATERLFDPAQMIFQQSNIGLIISHAYQYRPDRSGFAIECDPETWARGGFAEMAPEAMDRAFEEIFASSLQGHPLLAGTVRVFTPAIVKNRRWHHENVALIGDAVRTVHPSIGSGTRVGLRDAGVLAECLDELVDDLEGALSAYQQRRQFGSDLFQRAAIQSIKWYETLEDRLHFDPVTMAFSYMLRTGRVDYARLRSLDPEFVKRYEATPLPEPMEATAL